MTDFANDVVIPGLASGSLAGLFALAFVVMYRTTGVLNFAHGQLVMLMPLAVLVISDLKGLPVPVGFGLGLLVVIAVALVEERVAIRPFIQSGRALPWILSTLGFSIVIAELMALPYDAQSVRFPWGFSARAKDFLGLRIALSDVAVVLALVLLVVAIVLFDRKTTTGVRLRAVSQDKDGAAVLGISPGAASRLCAIGAAIIASITGVLLVSTQLVTPELGLTFLFNGFVAAAVGGLDSVPGTIVGGVVVGVVGQAASVYVGASYVQLVLFLVLLCVYLVRPHGIFGRASVRAV